jgi:nitrite reductase/ring-hydroxylating ferredoxin subunit/DMSO/TMAO reductase YedYZ heme-binding membrane subunit
MGHQYKAVGWNGTKIVYDLVMLAAIAAFLGAFMANGLAARGDGHAADPAILLIRGLGLAAFLMLTATLLIGPLARLSRRFGPFLYNRRHLGVTTFLLAAAHFGLALFWYHGSGPLNPFVSLLVSNPAYDVAAAYPFEIFGLFAFAVLFLMAATSHDYWLNNLSAPFWKALHMLVYPAYAALTFHIGYGAMMLERPGLYPALAFGSLALVGAAHLVAGLREWARDRGMAGAKAPEGWIDVCAPEDIPDKRAVIAPLPGGERVAVFRDGAKIMALTNVCRHQNGPLGEGRIVDGCVTCPWHGWQYDPTTGVSPPPYTERVATYDVQISRLGRIFVRVKPNRPGTRSKFAILVGSKT